MKHAKLEGSEGMPPQKTYNFLRLSLRKISAVANSTIFDTQV